MLALGSASVLLTACALSPLSLLSDGRSTQQPPIELKRCDDAEDVLCVLTFGIEPPDQMLILMLTVPGLPEELAVSVIRDSDEMAYSCIAPVESPTVVYCTGPQIPLGSTVTIEVFAVEEQMLLATGRFVLTAFAMPTVPASGAQLPTPGAALTPQGTRRLMDGTPTPATAYPNATPKSPPQFPPISPP